MSRIDIQTLCLAFEKRIEALEKNPPDKVRTSVIIKLLENSIEDVIKEHFLFLIKKEIKKNIKDEGFTMIREDFIKRTIANLFTDEELRGEIEKNMKRKVLMSFDDSEHS